MTPPIAVTLGDPRGIGPEVAFRAAEALASEASDVSLVLVGPERFGDHPHRPDVPFRVSSGWDGSEADAGRAAVAAIRLAVSMAEEGSASAVTTGPLHKPALHAGGWNFPGHTELLQELTGVRTVAMLMAAERTRLGGPFRVLLATTHLPLREVADALTADVLVAQTRLLQRSLRRDWGLERPRLALCALNPHASDEGLFGDEEARVYAPALERLEDAGMDVEGPLPADTVFRRVLDGTFDAVVAPYHDVGMAAFKTAAFGSGVNVTLGLPFVRTSPDHGTAFDLAGSWGRADPRSMVAALKLAHRLAANRFDTSLDDV